MRYRHGDMRLSGVVVPLSAIRTESSPGCGEYPDLAAFGALAARWGIELIQLLPIQDTGAQRSPYSALSAFALHPLYIRIQDLPELGGRSFAAGVSSAVAADIVQAADLLRVAHSGAETVPHEDILAAKLTLLERVWLETETESRRVELDAWIASHPWILKYAAFVELKRRNAGLPWWNWAEEFKNPREGEIDSLWRNSDFTGQLRFHAWVQMRADEQMRRAAQSLAALGIELMGDIPILMNEDSAEVWADRSLFRMGLIAGAPPDMYSTLGQNWGFPIYDWTAQAGDGFSFWKSRLKAADAYYSAYRIDHVLGFFRIWALSDRDRTGYLGHFVPDIPASLWELRDRGFSDGRIRWLSRPHVRSEWLTENLPKGRFQTVVDSALDRVGSEDLFLFKPDIRGEKDIGNLGLDELTTDLLERAWRDRTLYEFEPGNFVLSWNHVDTTAWASLSGDERGSLAELFERKRIESEVRWAAEGERILRALADSVPMLACAEDLGSVPDCVPLTLEKLGILGLRVLRWTRRWSEPGSPYVAPTEYPELSVACPSVHDSTCLREWWEKEAERETLWKDAAMWLGMEARPCPESLDPESADVILSAMAKAASRIVVYPVQDLLALTGTFRNEDQSKERINVPGTTGGRNWVYRMEAPVSALEADMELAARIARLAAARKAPENRSLSA